MNARCTGLNASNQVWFGHELDIHCPLPKLHNLAIYALTDHQLVVALRIQHERESLATDQETGYALHNMGESDTWRVSLPGWSPGL